MKKVPGTSLVITEPMENRTLPAFSFPQRFWEDGEWFSCETVQYFHGYGLRLWWLPSRRPLSIYPRGSFARTTHLVSAWARREGEETKSKKQQLKLGANVYRLTCPPPPHPPLALVHFSSAPLTMLQDGGMAHLWNNISTVVTEAKTAPSLSLGWSHQSAT